MSSHDKGIDNARGFFHIRINKVWGKSDVCNKNFSLPDIVSGLNVILLSHLLDIIIHEVIITMNSVYGHYCSIRNGAWEVLIDYKVDRLPVSVVGIANAANIDVVKNSDVDILKGGELGVSILDGSKWAIIYDDTRPKEQIRFTIAHELGHIFLGHPLKSGYHARTFDKNRPDIERDADKFAARLLCPACVLWALNLHTADEIKAVCNVSYTAAKIRAERMEQLYARNKFLTSPLEKKIYINFKNYIDEYTYNNE